MRRTRVLIGLLVAGLLGWFTTVLVAPEAMTQGPDLPGLARNLTAELFLVAGVACFARWRISRRPEPLHSAIALTIVAMTLPALAAVIPWTNDGVHVAPLAAIVRVGMLLIVFAVLGRRRTRSVTTTAGPGPWPVVAVLAAPGAAVAVLADLAGAPLDSAGALRTVACAAEIVAAAGWALLGLQRRARAACAGDRWTAAALGLMALGEAVRAIAVVLPGRIMWDGLGLQLAAAAVVAAAAASELRTAHSADGERTSALAYALAHTRRLLEDVEQTHRERLHDARSAIFGVIGASELLAGTSAPTTIDRATLQQLIAAELTRLQALLDTGVAEEVVDFDLADVLTPTVLAHRIGGVAIRLFGSPVRVHGRPRATATVLDNLLRNASVHAAGAVVTIRTLGHGERIVIVVEDDGPGIPAAERKRVLAAGARGSTARGAGSGLGLHNCLAAVTAQGGELTITEASGGGLRVVVTLPAATSATLPIAS